MATTDPPMKFAPTTNSTTVTHCLTFHLFKLRNTTRNDIRYGFVWKWGYPKILQSILLNHHCPYKTDYFLRKKQIRHTHMEIS
jgi:hypothetical protein